MNSIALARHRRVVMGLKAFHRRWVRARELTMCREMLEALCQ